MSTPALFYRDGSPFTGDARTENGKKFWIVRRRRCGRCGGAGGSSKWQHTGWTCYDCGGACYRGTEEVPLYTAEKLAKLNVAAEKREAKRVALAAEKSAIAEAEAAARREVFEAAHGEFLNRAETILAGDEVAVDVIARARVAAKISEPQVALLTTKIERAEERARAAAASSWIGKVGDRIEAAVKVEREASYERTAYGRWGAAETVWIMTMVDEHGNQIVSKSPNFRPTVGETITLRATVKEHSEYRGIKQTVVQRPKEVA